MKPLKFCLLLAVVFTQATAFALQPDVVMNQTVKKLKLEYKESLRQAVLPGFEAWTQGSSNCRKCDIQIIPKNDVLLTDDVHEFLQTLVESKSELQGVYGIHGQEYNLLALMAVGILGRESRFFESTRYKVKEAAPELITVLKKANSVVKNKQLTLSSRGPTQIKIVPFHIQELYGFKSEDLGTPRYAALATMGYLIEAYQELKLDVRRKNLTYITSDKIADYLPYIYFGAKKALYKGTATPERNIYIQDMKKYMSWVQLYEKH